jgi:hypothetical protein
MSCQICNVMRLLHLTVYLENGDGSHTIGINFLLPSS